MKRNFYTQADIELLNVRGIDELFVDEHDVVLELAKEAAERYGISIISKFSVESTPQKKGDALLTPPYDIQTWRKQFPILEEGIHLANCSQSPQSKHSRKTIDGYLDNWNEIGMNWEEWVEAVDESKAVFAKLINCNSLEVAMLTSVSQATYSIASALDYSGRRNKVVVTEAEFPTVVHIWTASKRLGFELEFVPLTNGEIDLADYEKIIDERTLIVCIPQVYYQNGFKQDIAPICQIAHKKGALLYVDAYQCLGTDPVDVKALDIDILSTGNLKYLLGLPGSAYLYVKKDIIPYLKPMATGWFGQENPFAFDIHNFQYASDGRRFDTGTPSIITAYAAKAGMEIINEVGVPNIKMWVDELSRYTIQELDKRGLETTSPREISKKGPTTAIVVPDPHAVEGELKKRKIVASARGPILRFAPHFFVTHEDIDRALDNLKEILKDMGSQ
ncbi:aminotransferase class V-fold PLP-dependent enzyme [Acidobacteriota bacterium]